MEQLGHDTAAVRLGGLHVLERLAQANLTQRQTIIDVICAYLRMPYLPPDADETTRGATTLMLDPEAARGRSPHARRALRAHLRTEPARDLRDEEQVRLTAQRILAHHLCRPADLTISQSRHLGRRPWERSRMAEPDYEWIKKQLDLFIEQTEPRKSSRGSLFREPTAPEGEVIAQAEVIEPILNKFYPEWRTAIAGSQTYRWKQCREACAALPHAHREAGGDPQQARG